jgi:hypothetical protein
LDCPKGKGPRVKAQGTGHRAQGKNNKRKPILSLCLAPDALCPKPLLLAKPFNSLPKGEEDISLK